MATNENVNKVIYGNQTVMDITDTTAEEADVASGEVFYKANGARSVGTLNKDSAVWGNIEGTLSDQTDLQTELNRAYTKTASETSSIDDLDLIPVQKISASSDGRRNIKFRNLKQILTDFFDTVYQTILTLPLSTANGGTGNADGYIRTGLRTGTTIGNYSTIEGGNNRSPGNYAHSEGSFCGAEGSCSHAEGRYTTASGNYSHSEGANTSARGENSHAEGQNTIAEYKNQHAQGVYNDNKSTTLFEVGNGTSSSNRSNAFEVYSDGHMNVNGDIYQNGELYNDEATQGLLKSTVGWTGKNLLENNAVSKTVSGVTFTVNSDKSITANGTATAETTLWLVGDGWNYSNCKDIPLSIEDNTEYIFGGETDDSSNAYMQLVIKNSDDTNLTYWISYGTRKKVSTSVINRASQKWHCWIRINNGTTVTNKTFYPMLRDASITDDTYEPYHESVEEEIEQMTDSVKSINSKLLEIEDFVGYEEDYVLGLQVDYDNSTFKRLGAAVGKTAGTSFNAFNMYGNRKRCTVADNGTINHYYGDSGYAEDGSDGQVMVRQPKFYYRVAPIKTTLQSDGHGYVLNKCNYYISDEPLEGFKLHPAFIDGSGNELDYYLIGAYEGCLYDVSANAYITDDAQVMDNANDKFSSIAGAKPASGLTQDLTRPKIEQMCQNRGSRWHELSMQIASAEQMLMLIEYGHFDMQRAIGKGVVDFTDDGTNNMAGTTGSTASLGNTSGRASSTSFTVAGTTTTQTVDGKTSVSYRGVENPYGNIWKFVMGMNVHGNGSQGIGVPYICTDYNYQEAKITDNYVSAGFHLPDGNGGWVKNMGYGNPDLDWAFLPATIGGSNALPVGDNVWGTQNLNEDRIAVLGALWNDAWAAGAFAWDVNGAVGYRRRHRAGRLIRLPEAVA